MAQSGGAVGKTLRVGKDPHLPLGTYRHSSLRVSCLLAFLSRSLFPTGLFPSCGQGLSQSPHGGKEDPSQSKELPPLLGRE